MCEPVLCSGRFAEMQPVFKNVALTRVDLGQFMRWYAEDQYIMTRPRRMLVGSVRGDNILLGTPLLRLYLNQGLEATRVYQVIEYDPKTCFRRYGARGPTRVRCLPTERKIRLCVLRIIHVLILIIVVPLSKQIFSLKPLHLLQHVIFYLSAIFLSN